MSDFDKRTIKALARRGIKVMGLTVIPGSGPLPMASGSRGYCVDDNGTHRVWTFAQVLDAA